MGPEESPKTKYERLQRRFQEEILTKYPNPERKGCPGDAALKAWPLALSMSPWKRSGLGARDALFGMLWGVSGFQSAIGRDRAFGGNRFRWGIAAGACTLALTMFYLCADSVRIKAPPECRTCVRSPNNRH